MESKAELERDSGLKLLNILVQARNVRNQIAPGSGMKSISPHRYTYT